MIIYQYEAANQHSLRTIRMKRFQYLIRILYLLWAGICSTVTPWTVVPDYSVGNVYTTEGSLYVGTVSSMTHCAVECHVTKYCVAIGYGNVSGICYHYSLDITILPTASLITTSNPITYYRVTCDNGFLYLQDFNRCVMLFEDRLTWKDADEVCETLGGHLLVIKSRTLLDYFQTLSYYTANHFWLAGRDIGSGVWQWPSRETIDSSAGAHLWKPGHPNGVDSCMESDYLNSMGMLTFQSRNCSTERKFYCQTSVN